MALKDFAGGGSAGSVSGGAPPMMPSMTQVTIDPMEYMINYNTKFATAGTILFRDEVIQQTLSCLIGKNKPNCLLIGPAGVGKTKICEDIAYRLVANDPIIPDQLKGFTIYELPLSNIVSGSHIVGELEEKAQAIVEFCSDPANKAILFIDEIHQLMGNSQTYGKIAQILKPALARGEMRVIGATTLQEASDLTDDPALNRRFSRVIVDELTRAQTIEIVKQARGNLIKHYQNKITIDDDVIESICRIADNYKSAGSHRPDNALTLLDRTIGDTIVKRKVQEKMAANDPALLAAIQSVKIIPVTEKQAKSTAMRLMTGSSKKEAFDEARFIQNLSAIQGQPSITDKLPRLLARDSLGIFPRTKPLTMLFVGPSGVGKTETAKIIAKEVTGTEPIILNMTEYTNPSTLNRIIGAPAGYIGSDSHAELPFDCLESNPYQVILLDEFEKGDKSVQRLFMNAFDEGYIKTNRGKTIDFSKSIIIATTNAANKKVSSSIGFVSETKRETSVSELSEFFDIELLNRFSLIVSFLSISKDTYRNILEATYTRELERIRKDMPRVQLPDVIPDDELSQMVDETYEEAFGARPANRTIQKYIEERVLP